MKYIICIGKVLKYESDNNINNYTNENYLKFTFEGFKIILIYFYWNIRYLLYNIGQDTLLEYDKKS